MSKTRNNHYVPEWYQKGFLLAPATKLHYLDLEPDKKQLPDGRVITMNNYRPWPPSKCFVQRDLYTTFFGSYINDEIERYLFDKIDDAGSRAVRAFIHGDASKCHKYFSEFFAYIDAQKIRTPKGLNWIRKKYYDLDQVQLMIEMQSIRNMNCTIWTEGVREIVSTNDSSVKFILSDHPVTIYNHACSPETEYSTYPDDPPIAFKGTQTIFPLNLDYCLILTNYEYAKDPENEDPIINRTNARNFSNSLVRTDSFIRSRKLNEQDVEKINFIIKARAHRYIAASEKEWLYPERNVKLNWSQLRPVLLPPKHELFHYGGEMYVGYEDGTTYYQDAFGRTTGDPRHLKKPKRKGKIGANDLCICGSGKKYKKCCRDIDPSERPSSTKLSIRERNLLFCKIISNILGLSKGKTWDDVRAELSNDQVKDIHEAFGSLWPIDTNIVELLPKPDKNNLRALYTGIIDPRVITKFATSLTLYFDEIIILNPFINPSSVKPAYSPVHSPHQFKQETLKNVLLLMELIPFIETGYINFIPDPCVFNWDLRKQIWDMAQDRLKNHVMDDEHVKQMKELNHNDFERIQYAFPEKTVRRLFPHFSEEQVNSMVSYQRKKRLEDPLALLQDDVYTKNGGQLAMMNLSPNFELAFFIAQATGSFLFTDNQHRWMEIMHAYKQDDEAGAHNWEPLTSNINRLNYTLYENPFYTFKLRRLGKLGKIRKAFRNIYSAIQTETDLSKIEMLTDQLKQEFTEAHEISVRELGISKRTDKDNINDMSEYNFNCNFNCVIPLGGFRANNVQRILLSYGNTNYLKSVPMAIFTEQLFEDPSKR